jgi:hypothetical protein
MSLYFICTLYLIIAGTGFTDLDWFILFWRKKQFYLPYSNSFNINITEVI